MPCFKLIIAGRKSVILVVSFTALTLHLRVINKEHLTVPPRTQSCEIAMSVIILSMYNPLCLQSNICRSEREVEGLHEPGMLSDLFHLEFTQKSSQWWFHSLWSSTFESVPQRWFPNTKNSSSTLDTPSFIFLKPSKGFNYALGSSRYVAIKSIVSFSSVAVHLSCQQGDALSDCENIQMHSWLPKRSAATFNTGICRLSIMSFFFIELT